MPAIFSGLWKPEYRARPSQILRRVWRGLRASPCEVSVRLPWGNELHIFPKEIIDEQIYMMGVFDLSVSEALWRLTEPGALVFDVGANIGYTASILARAAGSKGRVHAFEPHPTMASKFRANSLRWPTPPNSPVTLHEIALGRCSGSIDLRMPDDFDRNPGLASIRSAKEGGTRIPVSLRLLDSMVDSIGVPSLIKIDVEGAEEEVLEGSRRVLARRVVRDIVFEDEGTSPTAAQEILTHFGYTIFSLRVSNGGPVVTPLGEPAPGLRPWDSPSYIATLDVSRVRELFQLPGWRCLRGSQRV